MDECNFSNRFPKAEIQQKTGAFGFKLVNAISFQMSYNLHINFEDKMSNTLIEYNKIL